MPQASIIDKLRRNLAAVEERIERACRRADRSRSEVTLVAVTKTMPEDVAGLLPQLGIDHLGENRPQELWRKASLLPPTVRWHLIGHLQRNKVERTLPLVECIHSVDSLRLLEALEHEAARQGRRASVFLEVNASGEASKLGFAPDEVSGLVPAIAGLSHIQVRGLMTMAELQEPDMCRPTFALLRGLRNELAGKLAPTHHVEHLSMGMSNDFEVAIEEGATFVRLGSVLFEGIAR